MSATANCLLAVLAWARAKACNRCVAGVQATALKTEGTRSLRQHLDAPRPAARWEGRASPKRLTRTLPFARLSKDHRAGAGWASWRLVERRCALSSCMYSSGVTAENYLRGVQETASDGTATFTTVGTGALSVEWLVCVGVDTRNE